MFVYPVANNLGLEFQIIGFWIFLRTDRYRFNELWTYRYFSDRLKLCLDRLTMFVYSVANNLRLEFQIIGFLIFCGRIDVDLTNCGRADIARIASNYVLIDSQCLFIL